MTDTPDPADADPGLDRALHDLFAPVRPDAGLEDRMVNAVQTARFERPPLQLTPRVRRALTAVAAVLLLGAVGAMFAGGRIDLSLPGGGRMEVASLPLQDVGGLDDGTAESRVRTYRDRGPTVGADGAARSGGEVQPTGRADIGQPMYAAGAAPPPAPMGGLGGGLGGGGFGGGLGGVPAPGLRREEGSRHVNGIASNGYFVPDQQKLSAGEGGATNWFDSPTGRPSAGGQDGQDTNRGDRRGLKAADTTRYKNGTPDDPAQPPAAGEPKGDPKAPAKNPSAADPVPPGKDEPQPVRRVVIRSGEIEYEVESFDSAVAAVTKLATGIKGAFVATTNSDKLPNGKQRGVVVVRCPPEALDGLVLDIRRELGKGGEIKGVKLTSADITKQYTDLESRLRAARTMETRLLQIIKEGKGEIKQLLEAEKELGVWRTKIEETEGELRYFANLAALSTLTVTLAEKEAKAAAGVTEAERVQAGVEVEDVDKAYRDLQASITEAKGRVYKAELKQLAAGQFNATLNFEVSPDASGPLRDRLRQLGRVARLEVDRAQQADAGGSPVAKDAKVRRGDTAFLVQLYNLANVAPRETVTLQVAAEKVPDAYQALREAVGKATGRVTTAQLNEQDRQNVTAQFDFEVRRADEPAVRAAVDAAGEVVSRQAARAAEGDAVTDSKVGYRLTLLPADKLPPRETTGMTVEVADVDAASAVLAAQVGEAGGRVLTGSTAREASGRVTAKRVYEVPLAAAAGVVERFKAAGVVKALSTSQNPQAPDPKSKYATARLDVTLTAGDPIVAADGGIWPPIRRGLTYSASALFTSLTWVVFGLCVVLPWVVIALAGYRAARWATRPAVTPAATTPAPTG